MSRDACKFVCHAHTNTWMPRTYLFLYSFVIIYTLVATEKKVKQQLLESMCDPFVFLVRWDGGCFLLASIPENEIRL